MTSLNRCGRQHLWSFTCNFYSKKRYLTLGTAALLRSVRWAKFPANNRNVFSLHALYMIYTVQKSQMVTLFVKREKNMFL